MRRSPNAFFLLWNGKADALHLNTAQSEPAGASAGTDGTPGKGLYPDFVPRLAHCSTNNL